MIRKQRVLIFCAVLFSVFVLAACGGNSKSPIATDGDTQENDLATPSCSGSCVDALPSTCQGMKLCNCQNGHWTQNDCTVDCMALGGSNSSCGKDSFGNFVCLCEISGPDGDEIEAVEESETEEKSDEDGDTADRDVADGDTTDGDTADGDTTDGDTAVSGTWTDSSSGLTWQKTPFKNEMIWQEAINYCDGLSLDGHSDWRLPSISELRSLIRGCQGTETGGSCGVTDSCLTFSCERQDPNYPCDGCGLFKGPEDSCYLPIALDGAIYGSYGVRLVCGYYWSSSLFEDTNRLAWCVSFDAGEVFTAYREREDKPDLLYVRCVR